MRNLSLRVSFCILFLLPLYVLGPFELIALAAETMESGSTTIGEPLPTASPGPESGRKKSIALAADYLEYKSEDDSYEARGDVVLSQGGVELKSEELLWQTKTQDVSAQGEVQLYDDGTEITGSRLQYNLATGQGQVRDGNVYVLEGNFHFSGAQIEKRGQAEYFVSKGSFTTCDGEIPDWKFTANEVDVTLGNYARAKHVWFHIRDVPVLYTPYLIFPVKTERQSGFLAPSFGYSNYKGTIASLAWYQVIDRSMDATIYLDYLSDIGLGKGLEYRYALPKQNNGKALYYNVTGLKGTPDLYYLEWGHHGEFPEKWRLTADVEYVDDKLFFEEFSDTAAEYSRDKTVSTVMLQRNWQRLNLVGYTRYIEDLEDDNFDTVQRVPEIGLNLIRYRLGGTPIYVGVESYATHFWNEKGADVDRLFLKPSLSAVITPGPWLELVPQIALYERIYNSDSDDNEQTVPEFSLVLATQLVKDFDVNRWGVERIQHSIEPKVLYTYVHDDSQVDLPLLDTYDRNVRQNNIAYAVINRLVSRSTAADGAKDYREIFNLRLSQDYDIDEARSNLSGDNEPFSDVRLELDLRPTRKISLDVESLLPVYGDRRLRTLTLGATASDDDGNAARINYSYKNIDFSDVATDYIRLQLDTSLFKPVYVQVEERFDFREGRELEKVLGLEYRAKCWSIFLTYRDRYREDSQDDQEVMFAFVLAGTGLNSGFGGGF